MVYVVSITSQGQISIPAAVRREIGLEKNKKAILTVDDNKNVVLSPVKDILELRGSLKSNKKPLKNEEIHEYYARESV